jgi:oxygen-independent coproporphyrinogen-3 oxidase
MHLYIHVPFCARKCSYCDFAIAIRSRVPEREFVDAVLGEWHVRRRHPSVAAARQLDTLYFGGGTPSRLGGAALGELIGRISSDLSLAVDAEVTVETNPDDVTPELASALVAAGVNRISLGVQSHDPAVLAWMHRTHGAAQVAPAIAMLRDAGITNLSLDLIFALPREVPRDWQRDLGLTLELEPEHISLYGLTVEPHTPLARWTERGSTHAATDDQYAEQYLGAHRALRAAGYDHYEVSNAGRPGFWSRHNNAYWSGAEYLGLGPSAHSLLHGVRSWNIREWAAYQHAGLAAISLEAGSEELTSDQLALERVYLGLRTIGGLPASSIPVAMLQAWLDQGWAVVAGDRVRLTALGWLRLDALVSRVAVP